LRWSEGREWKLGERPRHADDQSPGQTYLELYLLKKDPVMIAHTKSTIDAMLNAPKPGREDGGGVMLYLWRRLSGAA